jgi:hypothetical protein
VRAIVKAAVDRGTPYQAFNLLALAKRLFNWAIDQHVYGFETSLCDRLKPKASCFVVVLRMAWSPLRRFYAG